MTKIKGVYKFRVLGRDRIYWSNDFDVKDEVYFLNKCYTRQILKGVTPTKEWEEFQARPWHKRIFAFEPLIKYEDRHWFEESNQVMLPIAITTVEKMPADYEVELW